MRKVLWTISALLLVACGRTHSPQAFATAEEATQALVTAARSADTRQLLKVLGEQAGPVIDSGDPVQDSNARARFVQAYEQAHTFDDTAAGMKTLEVGTERWPFPFVLVEREGRWQFDSSAGVDEVINRRVGANELATIQSCLAFVDAEREYYSRNPQQESLLHFAQKLLSTPGKKDGLYWPTTAEESPSPLGESFAAAHSEGYFREGTSSSHTPYHGYVYRMLTRQGTHAGGGAYDYLVRGEMLGGFALIAVPAEYGNSGVMTFIVNHDGTVFSKDLGAQTATVAMDIDSFDPDSSWQREASISNP